MLFWQILAKCREKYSMEDSGSPHTHYNLYCNLRGLTHYLEGYSGLHTQHCVSHPWRLSDTQIQTSQYKGAIAELQVFPGRDEARHLIWLQADFAQALWWLRFQHCSTKYQAHVVCFWEVHEEGGTILPRSWVLGLPSRICCKQMCCLGKCCGTQLLPILWRWQK